MIAAVPEPEVEPVPDDIAALREQFGPSWTLGTVWVTVANGPDIRRIWAAKNGFLYSAFTAEELAFNILRDLG